MSLEQRPEVSVPVINDFQIYLGRLMTGAKKVHTGDLENLIVLGKPSNEVIIASGAKALLETIAGQFQLHGMSQLRTEVGEA
jgi:hypothetical protein